MSNPFNISFGRKPASYIDRLKEVDAIIEDFSSDRPSSDVYIIAGSRGCGKTVFLSKVSDRFRDEKGWIVVDPGSRANILENVAAEIYGKGQLKHLFKEAEFSFSFHGLSFSLRGKEPVPSINMVLQKMFEYLKRKGTRVLITIDEVRPTEAIKDFIYAFQYFQRLDYDMVLLMTGLYENVSQLMRDKGLTFLYRAPKIFLGPLSLGVIANRYEELLGVEDRKARDLAKATCGFAYAYQLLGYILYETQERELSPKVLSMFDQYLAENVYDEIYRLLSEQEKKILFCMKDIATADISFLKEETGMESRYLNVYRTRLIKKGILLSPERGKVKFALPRFGQYLSNCIDD